MSDPLSEVLEMVGVESSVYFQHDFHAPWAMWVEGTGFAQFHIIVHGTAVVDHHGDLIELNKGDIVLFPKGAPHRIGDSAKTEPRPGVEVATQIMSGTSPFDGQGPASRLICGHFAFDLFHDHPLIQGLPQALVIKDDKSAESEDLIGILNILISETRNDGVGSSVVLRKLSDALLVFILRRHFSQSDRSPGFIAGLRDARIARVLQEIHNDSAPPPSLERLATVAGMSRSALAQTFKEVVGRSPIDYALYWKMLKARRRLLQSDISVEALAYEMGYGTPTAFTRAFSKIFGVSPRECRKSG